MRVCVSSKFIDESKKRDSSHCMIADAIKDKYPTATFVHVDIQTIRFSLDGQRFIYLTPQSAQQSLLQFDRGEEVKPFEVDLRDAVTITNRVKQRERRKPITAEQSRLNYLEQLRRRREGVPKNRPYPTKEREFGLKKYKQ